MSKFGDINCALCGRRFSKKHPSHKYCHWQCQSAANRSKQDRYLHLSDVIVDQRKKEVDLLGFAKTDTSEAEAEMILSGSSTKLKVPRGRYVYAWFNEENYLPFYIGKGVDDRAWQRHIHSNDGRSQLCQQLRASSPGFRVVIVRDNMTNEGSMLVESALISFVSACGGFLANQVDPLCRQERPPLEL